MQTWLYVLCLRDRGIFVTWEHADTTYVLCCTWQGCFCDLRTCRHDFTCCAVRDRGVFLTPDLTTGRHEFTCYATTLVFFLFLLTLDLRTCRHDFTCCAMTWGFFLTLDLRTCRPDFTCCAVMVVFWWPSTGSHANMTLHVLLWRGCFSDLRPKNMQTWLHVLCCDGGVFVTLYWRPCKHDFTCCDARDSGVFVTFDLRTYKHDFTCCAVTGVFLWPST